MDRQLEIKERVQKLRDAIQASPDAVWPIIEELMGAPVERGRKSWRYGSTQGGKGRSLQVFEGGLWKENNPSGHPLFDFKGSPRISGDLLHLVEGKLGLNFRDASNWIAGKLGLDLVYRQDDNAPAPIPVPTRLPLRELDDIGAVPVRKGGPAEAYLNRRGIASEVIRLFRLHEVNYHFPGQSTVPELAIALPYLSRDGKRVLKIKYRSVDGKKFGSSTGAPAILYGLHLILPHHRKMVMCESELDAISVKQALPSENVVAIGGASGVEAMSKVMGSYLDDWDEFILCFDNDDAGRKATRQLVEKLGIKRCRIVAWPKEWKDANEVLMKGDTGVLAKIIQSAPFSRPDCFVDLSKLASVIHGKYYTAEWDNAYMPEELYQSIRFLPWEVTLWMGPTSSGKSTLLRQIIGKAAVTRDEPCLFITLEDSAEDYLFELCYALRGQRPTLPELEQFGKWCHERKRIHIVDYKHSEETATVDPEQVERDIVTYKQAYGIRHAVIDNVTFLGVSAGEFQKVRELYLRLFRLAAKHKVHLHIVAHGSKDALTGIKNARALAPHEIRGPLELPSGAQNIISLYRDRRAETRESVTGGHTNLYYEITKLRRGGDETVRGSAFTVGVLKLLPNTKQFLQVTQASPINYLLRLP